MNISPENLDFSHIVYEYKRFRVNVAIDHAGTVKPILSGRFCSPWLFPDKT